MGSEVHPDRKVVIFLSIILGVAVIIAMATTLASFIAKSEHYEYMKRCSSKSTKIVGEKFIVVTHGGAKERIIYSEDGYVTVVDRPLFATARIGQKFEAEWIDPKCK